MPRILLFIEILLLRIFLRIGHLPFRKPQFHFLCFSLNMPAKKVTQASNAANAAAAAPAAAAPAAAAAVPPPSTGGKKPHIKKANTMAVTAKEGRAFIDKNKKKRKAKRNYSSYSSFIYKVLKQVHPDTGISTKVNQL
jgi:hypothetical protein